MARSENSGLIDLDALLREAGTREASGEAPAEPTPAPRAAAVVEAAPPPPPPPPPLSVVTPAPVVVRAEVPAPPKSVPTPQAIPVPPSATRRTDDSLEAVTSEPRTDPWIATEAPAKIAPANDEAAPVESRPRKRRPLVGIAIGGALALVAGGAVLLRPRTTAVDPQPVVASTPELPSRPSEPKAAPAALPPEAPANALRADDLPSLAAGPSASARPTSRAAAGAKGGRPAEAEGPTALTEAAFASGPVEHGDLGSAMRGAVGANDQPAATANEESRGPAASQLHPSQGALVGAIGAVLPTARACLGPDDSVRNGLVVFKSDGTVVRVDLRGSKPEDECVRSALSRAKVAPFVDDTFSTRVTVRP